MSDAQNLDDLLGSSDNEATAPETKETVDDLLGGSSDEEAVPVAGSGTRDEVDDLLGGSDDDDDAADQADGDSGVMNITKEEEAEEVHDELRFLGKAKAKESAGIESKQTTHRNLSLPKTFRIDDETQAFFMRTPNFIKLQRDAYNQNTHDPEDQRFSGATAVMRWRYKTDEEGNAVVGANGKPEMESNARFVKWSDGSYQLVIGDSVFDSRVLATENCYAFAWQKSIISEKEDGSVSQEAATGKEDVCLECIGSVPNRVILQPSLHQSGKADRASQNMYSQKISDKYKSVEKIALMDFDSISENPSKTLADLAKREEAELRREQRARELGRGGGSGASSRLGVAAYDSRRPKMSEGYLNSYDEGAYDGDNLRNLKSSIKNKTKNKPRRDYDDIDLEAESEEDDDEDDNEFERDGFIASDEEPEEEDEEEEEEDDENEEDDFDGEDDEEEEEAVESDNDDNDGDEEKEAKRKKSSKKDKKKSKRDKKKDKKKTTKDKKEKKSKKRSRDEDYGGAVDEQQDDEDASEPKKRAKEGELASSPKTTVPDSGVDAEEEERQREKVAQAQRALMQRKRNQRTLMDSDDDE